MALSVSPGLRIRHLLVVAGPSGAGKSTFLRQLQSGALAQQVEQMLPSGARHWPQTNGYRIRGRATEEAGENGGKVIDGLVLHYDIMRVVGTSIENYADDATLAALSQADQISAVLIRPPHACLLHQIAAKPTEPGGIAFLLKRMERRLRRLARPARMRVYSEPRSDVRHAMLRRKYVNPGFLEERYTAWRAYLEEAAGARLRRSPVVVAPEGSAGAPRFGLLATDTVEELRTTAC
jgi:hypothetical protein